MEFGRLVLDHVGLLETWYSIADAALVGWEETAQGYRAVLDSEDCPPVAVGREGAAVQCLAGVDPIVTVLAEGAPLERHSTCEETVCSGAGKRSACLLQHPSAAQDIVLVIVAPAGTAPEAALASVALAQTGLVVFVVLVVLAVLAYTGPLSAHFVQSEPR